MSFNIISLLFEQQTIHLDVHLRLFIYSHFNSIINYLAAYSAVSHITMQT